MLYKIDLDKQRHGEVNVIIRLPGDTGNDLRLSFRLDADQGVAHLTDTPSNENRLPYPPANAMNLMDCQPHLARLIAHLLQEEYATHAGKYRKGVSKIPVFRGEASDGLYVDSVDKKTGQNLLKGVLMKSPAKVKKLALWIISKFPQVSEWAGVQYDANPKTEEELAYIIVRAESCINNNEPIRLFQHG
ncbi:hypothetical protein VSS37_07555 [Candidatus Thiothrix sp. Deng01]|uniref:Uncharacterized protein n=1 Tax=Candidatus Thiothrix phosphatis TaxID=3112415 RepID=A0ABU6CVH3_9GAMM|nr:hypothetical protein [Candidatus Thiothrix sp. Deng01]MEB4590829.1 hypothetical protein [Candidatus Thiothrix sp. Deng01]